MTDLYTVRVEGERVWEGTNIASASTEYGRWCKVSVRGLVDERGSEGVVTFYKNDVLTWEHRRK